MEATASTFQDGWLRTGDLGYRVGPELYLCGRKKDLIIQHGKNYFPEDIERGVPDQEKRKAIGRERRPDQGPA